MHRRCHPRDESSFGDDSGRPAASDARACNECVDVDLAAAGPTRPCGRGRLAATMTLHGAFPMILGKRLDDLAVLAKSVLFARIAPADLGAFVDLLDQAALTEGTYVVREGDPGDHMFWLVEGSARVVHAEVTLRALSPGDHFGEMALLGARHHESVVATSVVRVARLSRGAFETLSASHPRAALAVLRALVDELGNTSAHLADSVGLLLAQRSLPRRASIGVAVAGEARSVPSGTALAALLPATLDGSPVVGALVDGKPHPLHRAVAHDAAIAPITLATWDGREIVRRGVSLALLEAASRVAPEVSLVLGPSVSAGRVVHVGGVAEITDDLVSRLSRGLAHVISENLEIREEVWATEEARALFAERGWSDAVGLLAMRRSSTVGLLRCGSVYALAEGTAPPSTGHLDSPRLLRHPDGLLLDFGASVRGALPPDAGDDAALAREIARPRFGFAMAGQHRAWLRKAGLTSVGALNAHCIGRNVAQLVRASEGFHEKRVSQIADEIAARRGEVRVVAIAGPSSSGKTTFIKRLTVQLEIDGVRAVSLSLDDYYRDRGAIALGADGKPDFEALDALDLATLRAEVAALLAGREITPTRFDFKTGRRGAAAAPLSLGPDDVLILEGIHGLAPTLLGDAVAAGTCFRIFLQPATTLPLDRLTTVAPADVRLLRRIVRDRHQRGYHAADNIQQWASVRRGEGEHIFPTLASADVVFDTSLAYEINVLKVYAERYLLEVAPESPAYPTAWRLRRLIDRFVAIYPDHVPPTSILREFIGGSGFEY